MKYVILGGGGFIGSAIADRLLRDGHSVRIFERPRVQPYRAFSEDEQVEWMSGDFTNAYDIGRAIAGVDAVLHLISTTLPKSSNDDPIYDVESNLVVTLQLLNAMVNHNVRRMVFISSGGTVYGIPEYLPIDERHPTEPVVSYGITKLAIEKYLHFYEHMHGIEAITLRVSNPYGERQRIETAQGAIGVFLERALTGKPVEIWGDGSVTRDYIYISDVAEAFVRALEYHGPKRVFNIGSGSGTSLNDMVAMFEDLLRIPIKRNYLSARPFDVPVNVLSNELARSELHWSPSTTMQEGILRTAAWMKAALGGTER